MMYNLNKMKTTIVLYLRAIRANQWIKNFIIFAAILFGGKLFEPDLLLKTIYAFFVFCLLSSASYVLNDIIDYQYDKKHPMKKYRPIASGAITIPQATFLVFVMTIVSLLLSLFFSLSSDWESSISMSVELCWRLGNTRVRASRVLPGFFPGFSEW